MLLLANYERFCSSCLLSKSLVSIFIPCSDAFVTAQLLLQELDNEVR